MAGLPVYGVAMCTLQGIRNVLHEVTKTAQAAAAPGAKVSLDQPLVHSAASSHQRKACSNASFVLCLHRAPVGCLPLW